MKKFLTILNLTIISSTLLLVPVGCGGGDGGTSGDQASAGNGDAGETGPIETTVTKASRSKSEFVQLADAICGKSYANRATEVLQYAKEHQRKGASNEELGIEAYRAVVAPKLPARIEELRALGAPKGDKKQVEAVLASLARVANAPDRLLFRELRRSSLLTGRYGIPRCAA